MNNHSEVNIFSIVPIDVLADKRLKLNHLRVLLALLSFRNKATNLTCPSRETLSARCGLPITRISEVTADLVEFGWLKKDGKGGFSQVTKYEILVPDLSEFHAETVTETVTVDEPTTVTETVTSTVTETVTSTVTETVTPILTDNITNNTTDNTARAQEKKSMKPEGMLACRLIKLGVKVTSMHPTLCKWVADKIPIELIEQCVALARQHKPAPEGIAANYLDSIIRSELRPKKPDKSWMMSDEATQAHGESLGVYAQPGESWVDYRQRVLTEHERTHAAA